MPKLNKESLEAFTTIGTPVQDEYIKIGMSTCGMAAGADVIYRTFVEETRMRHLTVPVQKCGCNGMCYAEPLVEVKVIGLPIVTYGKVTKDIAVRIVEKHVVEKLLLNECIFDSRYQELK
jgi:(2Fe-2S) ferredoxin